MAAHRRGAARLLALLLIVFVQPDRFADGPAGDVPAGAGAGGVDCRRLGAYRLRRDPDGFTFALAFLSWFAPLTNLTELRDRVLGILLGVLVSSIVHLYLWPDSEAPAENPPCGTLSPAGGLPRRPEGGGSAGSPACRLHRQRSADPPGSRRTAGHVCSPRPGRKAGRCAPPSPGPRDRPPQRRLPTQRRAGRPDPDPLRRTAAALR